MYDDQNRFDYGWNCARDDNGNLKPENDIGREDEICRLEEKEDHEADTLSPDCEADDPKPELLEYKPVENFITYVHPTTGKLEPAPVTWVYAKGNR